MFSGKHPPAVLLLGLLLLGTACSQPKLDLVGGASFDFGDLWTPSAKKLLTLRNRGNDTLIITNVSASCGCTGALVSHDHIAPGDSGTLAITFDASRFGGIVEKFVSFESNDAGQKHVSITFHANVNKALEFDPEYFYFSTYPDSLTSKELAVKNSSPVPIRILSVTSSSVEFSVKPSAEKILPGEDITLVGTLRVKAGGTYRGDITILTDHPKVPRYTIRYFALAKERK